MKCIRIPIVPVVEYPVTEERMIAAIRDVLDRFGYSSVIAVVNEPEEAEDGSPAQP